MITDMNLKVVIHAAEEGGFWAEVPALPGCVSQGETRAELKANIREAIEGWLMAEERQSSSQNRSAALADENCRVDRDRPVAARYKGRSTAALNRPAVVVYHCSAPKPGFDLRAFKKCSILLQDVG